MFPGAGPRVPHRGWPRTTWASEIGSNRLDTAVAHAAEWEAVARTLDDEELRATTVWPLLGPLLARGDPETTRRLALEQLEWTRDHPTWGMRDWGMSAPAGALDAFTRMGATGRARETAAALEATPNRAGNGPA